jgi:hypothetical protein
MMITCTKCKQVIDERTERHTDNGDMGNCNSFRHYVCPKDRRQQDRRRDVSSESTRTPVGSTGPSPLPLPPTSVLFLPASSGVWPSASPAVPPSTAPPSRASA